MLESAQIRKNGLILLIATVCSALLVWPWFVLGVNGDDMQHFGLIECFNTHVWDGHLYPRWCMNGNSGYGSPAPMFYQPLPYYILVPFYPLHVLGFGERDFLLLGIVLALVVGFFTCVRWLEPIAGSKNAVVCAVFLFMFGYYNEIATFRVAYPELWAVALLPILFTQVRNMILHRQYRWGSLSLTITICMLMHTIATMIGLMACGLYVLGHFREHPKAMLVLAASSLLAVLVTIANFFQYSWLTSYLGTVSVTELAWMNGWANNYVTGNTIVGRLSLVLGFYLICYLAVGIATPLLRKPGLIQDTFIRKELVIWGCIAVFAFFMMFPISAYAWDIIEAITHFRAPWRMRLLLGFAFVYLLAVFARYGWGVVIKKRWGDVASFLVLLLLLNLNMVTVGKSDLVEYRKLCEKDLHLLTVASPKWMDHKYTGFATFHKEFLPLKPTESIHILAGDGDVSAQSREYGDIRFHVESQHGGLVQIEHFYFPTWRAFINGNEITLGVQGDGKGRMQVAIPAGKHDVHIQLDWMRAMPSYYRWICVLSVLSACLVLGRVLHERKG